MSLFASGASLSPHNGDLVEHSAVPHGYGRVIGFYGFNGDWKIEVLWGNNYKATHPSVKLRRAVGTFGGAVLLNVLR